MKKYRILVLVFLGIFTNLLNAQDFTYSQKVVASDRSASNRFGSDADISGDYAIIGAYEQNSDRGAAYIFKHDGNGNWSEEQKLTASDASSNSRFGFTVSISDSIAVVGAYEVNSEAGAVYVFELDGNGDWNQEQKITAYDASTGDRFGTRVSLHGDQLLIGADRHHYDENGSNDISNAGAAYFYERNSAGTFVIVDKVVAPDRAVDDNFGYALAIMDDYAVITARSEDHDVLGNNTLSNAGSAYVFEKNGSGNWIFAEKIVASDRQAGDNFGFSASIYGDEILIGARLHDFDLNGANSISNNGACYIFKRDVSANWNQSQKLVPANRLGDTWFGYDTDIIDGYMIISGFADDYDTTGSNYISNTGAAFIFKKDGSGNWNQEIKLVAPDRASTDYFGSSVAISSSYALIGAFREDHDENGSNSLSDAGSAYFFEGVGCTETSSSITVNSCGSYIWTQTGQTYQVSGSYTDKINNAGGCDSIITLNLTINQTYSDTTSVTACGTYYWSQTDSTYGNSGLFVDSLSSAAGCDSLIFLNLTLGSEYQAATTSAVVCDSYTWAANGTTYYGSGFFTDTVASALGCDSIVSLDLTMHYSDDRALKAVASDREASAAFGRAVSISGSYAVVGADQSNDKGAAYILEKDGNGSWTQVQKLTASDGATGDRFGYSAAISNNTVIVGAFADDSEKGAAYIYERAANGTWSEITKLTASDASSSDRFGIAVAISDTLAIIGAYQETHDASGSNSLSNAGSAYIFKKSNGTWAEEQKLVASDRAADDIFGRAVSISGAYALVGAENEDHDENGANSESAAGSAYMYEYSGGIWTEVKKLVAFDRTADDRFGHGVSVSGNYALVGAYYNNYDGSGANDMSNAGSAYMFKRTGGTWQYRQKLLASDRTAGDRFGYTVNLSESMAVVGAYYERHDENGANSLTQAGSAYVYRLMGNTWEEVKKVVAPDREANDAYGVTVAIARNDVLIGASSEDHDLNGSNTLSSAGAAYFHEVYAPVYDSVNIAYCGNYTSPSGNYTWSSTGIYTDTVAGTSVCDSILIVDLTIYGDTTSELVNACESYLWQRDGNTYSNSGTYYTYDTEIAGCDTVWFELNFTIIQSTSNTISVSACENYTSPSGNYSWETSGTYSDTITNAAGCDSILTINLTIHENSSGSVTVEACDRYTSPSGNYTWNSSGTYSDTLTNSLGCDSILTINLTITIANAVMDTLRSCEAYSWPVNNETYYTSGTHYDTLTSSSTGCDSIVGLVYERENIVEIERLLSGDITTYDEFSTSVSVSGNYALIGANGDDDNGSSSGSAYVFERANGSWSQAAKLTASDGASGDAFGYSVSISGDYALIGAHGDGDNGSYSGSAYVFERINGSWTQVAKLTAVDGSSGDYFGYSVALAGDYALIGANGDDDNGSSSGSAYVFERSNGTWTEAAKLTASDGSSGDFFGNSVSLSGDYAVIGASYDDDGSKSGSAYVFYRNNSNWAQQSKVTASNGSQYDQFGTSVSIAGDYMVIGTYYNDPSFGQVQGQAYVFQRSGTSWSQQQILTASDGQSGDYFGRGVAIEDDRILVGAFDKEAAYLFERSGSTWQQVEKINGFGGGNHNFLGFSVALSGDYLLAGAPQANTWRGSAYLYQIPSSGNDTSNATACDSYTWSQNDSTYTASGLFTDTIYNGPECSNISYLQLQINYNIQPIADTLRSCEAYSWPVNNETYYTSGTHYDTLTSSSTGCDSIVGLVYERENIVEIERLLSGDITTYDEFSTSVSVSGNYALIGANGDDDNGSSSGSAYVFERANGSWSQAAKLTASDGASGDAFGYSVSISGDYALIGAHGDGDNGSYSGSAYVFERINGSWTQVAKLTAVDGSSGDYFGYSVALAGDYALIGANGDDDNGSSSGSAYVFERSNGTWTEAAKLTASDGSSGDFFGNSVSLSGDYAVIGASYDDDGSKSGSAYVFYRNNSNWAQQSKVTASNGSQYDQFGTSVSIAGDYMVIGTYYNDPSFGQVQGQAYVFQRSGTSWSQQQILTASDGQSGDYFGRGVAIEDDRILVGAFDKEAAYLFERSGSTWQQVEKINGFGGGNHNFLGFSVALSGDYLLAGAPQANTWRGSAYLYQIPSSGNDTSNATACDSYTWSQNDSTYTASGLYTDTIYNGSECSNISYLQLTINQVEYDTATVSACSNYTWDVNDSIYSTSGIYTDTLTAVTGCDSVLTINLTIVPRSSGSVTVVACDNYVSPSGNYTYNSSGSYTDTLTNTAGCDSIITLNLTINTTTAYVYNNGWGTDPSGVQSICDSIAVTSGNATLSQNTSVRAASVAPGTTLDLGSDTLTVVDTAYIQADVSGYAQIIGQIEGSAKWEVYLSSTEGRWYNNAFPVKNTVDTIKGAMVNLTNNSSTHNIYHYDATQDDGAGEGVWVMSQGADSLGKVGYQIYLDGYFGGSTAKLWANGELQNGDVSIPIYQNQSGNNAEGWNYIPNPYPSGIDFDALVQANSDLIGNTYYCWNGKASNTIWRSFNRILLTGVNGGEQYLAPGQAVFVQALQSGTLNFTNSVRHFGGGIAPGRYKTQSQAISYLKLGVRIPGTDYQDQSVMAFDASFSAGMDQDVDAEKRFNYNSPNLYTEVSGLPVVFNGISDQFQSHTEPLYFSSDMDSTYTIELDQDLADSSWSIILEDKFTKVLTNLRNPGASYSFNYTSNDPADRFLLHINQSSSMGVSEPEVNTFGIYAYMQDGELGINLESYSGITEIILLDMAGKIIYHDTHVRGGQTLRYPMNNNSQGIYFLKVISDKATELYNQKISNLK